MVLHQEDVLDINLECKVDLEVALHHPTEGAGEVEGKTDFNLMIFIIMGPDQEGRDRSTLLTGMDLVVATPEIILVSLKIQRANNIRIDTQKMKKLIILGVTGLQWADPTSQDLCLVHLQPDHYLSIPITLSILIIEHHREMPTLCHNLLTHTMIREEIQLPNQSHCYQHTVNQPVDRPPLASHNLLCILY